MEYVRKNNVFGLKMRNPFSFKLIYFIRGRILDQNYEFSNKIILFCAWMDVKTIFMVYQAWNTWYMKL